MNSSRLERLRGESSGPEPSRQRDEFLIQCIREGLDDDQIVTIARKHQPTIEAHNENINDRLVERRVARLREEHFIVGEPVPRYLDWSLLDQQPAEPDWCINEWIQRGDNVAVVGPPKIGKSLLMLEAAACKASGAPFLGRDLRAAPVTYMDWENRPDIVRDRVRQMGFAPADLRNLHYQCFPKVQPLDTAQGAAAVLRQVLETRSELLVIDALQRALWGDENSSQSIRDVYRLLLMPLRDEGVAVLRIDHLGKGDSPTARGSSAKSDDVDQEWLLTRRKDGLFSMQRRLSRSGVGTDRYVLARRSDPLRHDVVPDADIADDAPQDDEDPVGVAVEHLDRLEVAERAGRPTASQALQSAGYSASTDVVAAAVKIRKQRASA